MCNNYEGWNMDTSLPFNCFVEIKLKNLILMLLISTIATMFLALALRVRKKLKKTREMDEDKKE